MDDKEAKEVHTIIENLRSDVRKVESAILRHVGGVNYTLATDKCICRALKLLDSMHDRESASSMAVDVFISYLSDKLPESVEEFKKMEKW